MNKTKDWLDEVIEEHLEKTDEIPPLPQPFRTTDERQRWNDFLIRQQEHIAKTQSSPTTIYNWRDRDETIF